MACAVSYPTSSACSPSSDPPVCACPADRGRGAASSRAAYCIASSTRSPFPSGAANPVVLPPFFQEQPAASPAAPRAAASSASPHFRRLLPIVPFSGRLSFPATATRVCVQGYAIEGVRGPAGLGCPAPGTACRGMPFRVLRGPAGLGWSAPGLRTKVCVLGCCAASPV